MHMGEAQQPLEQRLSADAIYQQLLAECLAAERRYLAIRDRLPAGDAEALDRYITLCEELDHRKLLLASEGYAQESTPFFLQSKKTRQG